MAACEATNVVTVTTATPKDTPTDYAASSAVMKTYGRAEIAFESGEGCWLISETGERYLDCASGIAVNTRGLPKEKELSGHGVSWCATCDGFFFRDKVIAVVGGGDSAMEEANFLTKFASKVYIIHRRDSLKASKIMQQRSFDNPKIEFIWNSAVAELKGDAKLEGVVLEDTQTGEKTDLALEGLFIAIGNDPRVDLVENQVELTPDRFIKVDGRTSKTSLPGVFASGDVIDPTYRQAITAAGSGCVAALDAEHYLSSLQGE